MVNRSIAIESIEQLNEIMDQEELSILFFDTKTWGVGKVIFPKLIELAKEYEKKILKIDIDENLLIKGQFLVFTAPTVLIMRKRKEVLRESKFIDLKNIDRILELTLR